MAEQDNKNQQAKNARAEDGKKAAAEYEAQAAALRAKTERLKALRLAKEAADGPVVPRKVSAPKRRSGTKGKQASASLSDWLKDREREVIVGKQAHGSLHAAVSVAPLTGVDDHVRPEATRGVVHAFESTQRPRVGRRRGGREETARGKRRRLRALGRGAADPGDREQREHAWLSFRIHSRPGRRGT